MPSSDTDEKLLNELPALAQPTQEQQQTRRVVGHAMVVASLRV